MESEFFVNKWQLKGNTGHVSPLFHCETTKATDLCFYNIAAKLINSSNYDIGGTYTGDQSDFWFYYTTTMSHGYNFLLNLFVLPRKPACFTLTVPKIKQLSKPITNNGVKFAILYGPETEYTYRTTQNDQYVYVKTFIFNSEDIDALDKCILYMPLTIQVHSKIKFDPIVVKRIKLAHDLSSLMSDKKTADIRLKSNTGKEYSMHKILLAAHSPLLKSMLKKSEKEICLDVSDDVIEIMLEFLYTGTLANLDKLNCLALLETAEKLELTNLFTLAQQLLGDEIKVDNAIYIALQAKKYKLESLMLKVFEFVRNNPKVLSTEGWLNLEDVQMIKQMLQYIHHPTSDLKKEIKVD